MTFPACLQCHTPKTDKALAGKLTGSHLHRLNGVGCVECHGAVAKPKEVAFEKCTSCHATAALAERTATVKPANPHKSPHYGTNADCNLCHHQHEKSENYCLQCHQFDFHVP